MKEKKILPVVILILSVSGIITFGGCNDDPVNDIIPNVSVYRQINMNSPLYNSLNVPGGYIYLNEGYKGIIVYHQSDGTFLAMERTCTYKPDSSCSKVTVDKSNIFMACGHYQGDTLWVECCKSQFYMNGNVLEGPAVYPLKLYTVNRDGNYLTITN